MQGENLRGSDTVPEILTTTVADAVGGTNGGAGARPPFDAVLSDVDGTLLRPTHALSARTRNAVRACVARGMAFGIVSGRMPSGVIPLVAELGVPASVVCYSGAYVLGPAGEEVASVTIPVARAREVLALLDELWPSVTPCYFVGPHWYVEDPNAPMVVREADIVGAVPEPARYPALLGAGKAPNKIFCSCADAPGRSVEMKRVLAARFPDLTVIRSTSGVLVEIVHAGVDKALGARRLLDHLGLSMGRTLYFGDDANDVPLLRAAGRGVAMGNAAREIRKAADDVTGSNADDGLADYLERKVLA